MRTLQADPTHRQLMYDSYLTADLLENCRRFASGSEFSEVRNLIRKYAKDAATILDIPGGNGIATYAFSQAGFGVTAVEPDPSNLVGRGAIRHVLAAASLPGDIVAAYGEALPFPDNTFDMVYVRQGLHHARDLNAMLREYGRVTKCGGLLLACREPVVDDHGPSLRTFLDSQPDHQLYGGENAFTFAEYRSAIRNAGFDLVLQIPPYSNPINLHPYDDESLAARILASTPGRALGVFLPKRLVVFLGRMHLRHGRRAGRLYSFVATKPR